MTQTLKKPTPEKPDVLCYWVRSYEVLTLETSALEFLFGGQFTHKSVDEQTFVSTPHQRSTTVSLETNPLK